MLVGSVEAKRKGISLTGVALSHPVRLAFLRLMRDRTRRLSGEITAAFSLARTTVSQHLGALHKSGLLRAQTEGLTTRYWLNVEVAPRILRRLAGICAALCRCPVCGQGDACGCFHDGRRWLG